MRETEQAPTVAELWAVVKEQRAEIERLKAAVDGRQEGVRRGRTIEPRVSRAGLLKAAAASAAGLAAAAALHPEVASANTDTYFVASGGATFVDFGFFTDSASIVQGVVASGTSQGVVGFSQEQESAFWGKLPALQGTGVYGYGKAIGMRGESPNGDGVQGQANDAGSSGVYGYNSAAGKGVFGSSQGGAGVEGTSDTWIGVHGVSGSSTGVHGESTSGWAVYGHNAGSNYGVVGDTTSSKNSGVFGNNFGSGPGVTGTSTSGDGVQGTASDAGHSGVFGHHTSGGKGVFGSSDTSGSGVEGNSVTGPGVRGTSGGGDGVQGVAGSGSASGVFGNNPYGGKGVLGASSSGSGVQGSSTSGAGGSFASTGGRGATIQQTGTLAASNSSPCLSVTRSGSTSATGPKNYTGALIYGNDAPNTAGGGGSTGYLLQLQQSGANKARIDGSGNIVLAGGLALNGSKVTGKPTVSGQTGGNAALQSLLAALAAMGLITNSTS